MGWESVWPSTITGCLSSEATTLPILSSRGRAWGRSAASPEVKNTLSVSIWMTSPRRVTVDWTLPLSPASRASASTRRLSASRSCCSCSARLAFAAAEESRLCGPWLIDWIGRSAGTGGSAGAALVSSLEEPLLMMDLPPLSTAPEKASWSDFWSSSNFEVFTDEIENSTMKSANRSVIMSAKDASQRSPSSCSSSWAWPPLCRRWDAMGLRGRLLGGRASPTFAFGRALRGRDERDELGLDHARVVARLDREDALHDQGSGVQLGL